MIVDLSAVLLCFFEWQISIIIIIIIPFPNIKIIADLSIQTAAVCHRRPHDWFN